VTRKARVLIVDDSPTMRRLLRASLLTDPRIEVVAEAEDAAQARDAVNKYSPDVMTLDVEMPNMSGLEFLRRLMAHRPMPVVMVSTLTSQGSAAAVEALSLGAIECVEKPRFGNARDTMARLAEIVHMAAGARVREPVPRRVVAAQSKVAPFAGSEKIVMIGGSTGAVEALEVLLRSFPANCPPTLITQHMPAAFLSSFAARLDPLVAPNVRLASDGEEIHPGNVYIAPGGDYHLNLDTKGPLRTRLVAGPAQSGHRPSVDSMFLSAVPVANRVVSAILTGMGRDGAAGMLALKNGGARTIGQSEDSCVVFGMPRVAGEMGAVETWADLQDVGKTILTQCSRRKKVRAG
jgi:two-component system, chemotaxis family, protein-glutamate methylesterase/glutaminase